MKTTLIILNLLAAALVFPAMSILHRMHFMSAASMYTELDRAEVIDRVQLEKMFPDEANNDRYDIPKRFLERHNDEWIVGYPCVFGFVMNAILISLFMKSKRKPNHGLESTGAPPAAGTPETHP
ncbi:MAG: hypothetical protein AB7T27_00495 [Kiritimatiellia bacterium]